MVIRIKIALILLLFTSCTQSEPKAEFRLFTWSDYFSEETIKAFEAKHDVKVKVDYFASNEQMLARLQLTKEGTGYDLIVPTDYMIRTLIEMQMLAPIEKSKLTFLGNFEEQALNPPYDPGLTHSVPLSVGITGIAWNSKLAPDLPEPLTWKTFFEHLPLKGKVTLLDDTKEVLQAALFLRGKNLSNATEADVREAFNYLRSRKSQIKAFTAEARPAIASGECALCMAYSGDALSAAAEKRDIKFIIPSDGATIWTDNFAIPTNAKNPEMAYAFMNHVLSPEGARAFTIQTGYRTYNKVAKALLPKDISQSPIVYPEQKKSRLHFLVERRDLQELIDKEWARLLAE